MSNNTTPQSDDMTMSEWGDMAARLAAQQGAITMAGAAIVFAPALALPAIAVGAAVVARTFRD